MNKTFIRPSHSRPHTVSRSNVNKARRSLHAINNDMVTTTYFLGKGITLFTFFYTSLNWMMYKNINKDNQSDDENETNNSSNKDK